MLFSMKYSGLQLNLNYNFECKKKIVSRLNIQFGAPYRFYNCPNPQNKRRIVPETVLLTPFQENILYHTATKKLAVWAALFNKPDTFI